MLWDNFSMLHIVYKTSLKWPHIKKSLRQRHTQDEHIQKNRKQKLISQNGLEGTLKIIWFQLSSCGQGHAQFSLHKCVHRTVRKHHHLYARSSSSWLKLINIIFCILHTKCEVNERRKRIIFLTTLWGRKFIYRYTEWVTSHLNHLNQPVTRMAAEKNFRV